MCNQSLTRSKASSAGSDKSSTGAPFPRFPRFPPLAPDAYASLLCFEFFAMQRVESGASGAPRLTPDTGSEDRRRNNGSERRITSTIISCPLIFLQREKGRRNEMIPLRDVMVRLRDVMIRQRDGRKSANERGRQKRHMALDKTPGDGGPKGIH